MFKTTELSEVEIIESEKVEFKEPLLILGFAGAGLVGGIAVSHLIEQLKMKEIAHLKSRHVPPAVVFFDGKLRHPFRIYMNNSGKLCGVVCEVPLRSEGAYPIASALLDWAEEKGVKELVVLDSAAVRGMPQKRKAYCAAEPEKLQKCIESGMEMIQAGLIGGITGSVLDGCLSRKISAVAFLVPTVTFMPDPEGAVYLINALNSVYGLDVNTEKLMARAEEIKQKLKEVAERSRKITSDEEKRGNGQMYYVS